MTRKLLTVLCCALVLPVALFVPANAAAESTGAVPKMERITCGTVNCFIVSQQGGAILVDTGTAMYRRKILNKCRAANVSLIVITHGHYDHTQNAAYLAEKLGVPIAMHSADIPLLKGLDPDAIKAHNLLGKLMVLFMKLGARPVIGKAITWLQNNEIPIFAPDIELRGGDSLEAYGVSASVVALPGHTMGSIGLKAGSSLIVGDALMNILWPQRALHYLDRAAMEKSAGKISGYGGSAAVHFGHGKPVANRIW